ncbi:hypothetical protein [Sphingomonas bacterium]|uniref:hypothetical protein n=1 Tax=Sphingomonas bacterium TaxID=1895847 RepID=UPI0026172600|nr:hypothetical protein [Sphingomonas bacterium]MDB5680006.1 hypothetical protein [Sphingomonas bacterium]
MIKQTGYVAVAALCAMSAAAPAAANPAKGYRVVYVAERGHYCVTPLRASEAERLGIALYRSECHSMSAWTSMGFQLSRG